MTILYGKKTAGFSAGECQKLMGAFHAAHIDIGTGSGRFVLKNALKDPRTLYIGADPAAARMAGNAVRARKRKLANALFVAAAAERMPPELTGVADAVTVCLPWGSLRDGLATADPVVLNGLRMVGKPGASLTVWIGYDGERDGEEARSLPPLTAEYLAGLAGRYSASGIRLLRTETLGRDRLLALESDWAKRLAYGAPRTTVALHCIFTKPSKLLHNKVII